VHETTADGAFLADLAAAVPWLTESGQPVVVAVSGGADSVGLLVGLVRLEGIASRLVVAHAEHDLRAEAPAERAGVVRLASGLGLPCTWRRLAVRSPADRRGEGLEGRARRIRYAFLTDVARSMGARRVLVAHTADDQAETILHRALRGTGVAGLGGMARARSLCDGIALVRPLLGVSRAAVRGFVRRTRVPWCEDPSNADTSRSRNFLRHEVLPRCAAGPYPAATAALVRLGGQAAGVAAALASAADHLLDRNARSQSDGSVVLLTRDLAGLDPALVAEVFVALWRRESWPQRDMTGAHYQALARMLRAVDEGGRPPAARDLPGGIRVAVGPQHALEFRSRHSDISTRR
jgi:tRNA(Ile)-lysidine synthase